MRTRPLAFSTRLWAATLVAALCAPSACTRRPSTMPRPSLTRCSGLFTTVPLPAVDPDEERALNASLPVLSRETLTATLRENYYLLVYEEGGGTRDDTARAFAAQRIATEEVPLALLAGIAPDALAFVEPADRTQVAALTHAIEEAQAPLVRRLHRVTHAIAIAAEHPEVTAVLDARMGLNTGAEIASRSRRIFVGPWFLVLTGSEDALGFVLGHEFAHISRGHTWVQVLQEWFGRSLTFGVDAGPVTDTLSGILTQGSMPAFNRDKECEADYYGLQYMLRAGYHAEEALRFWRLMIAVQEEHDAFRIPFLSPYPPDTERLLRLAHWAHLPPGFWQSQVPGRGLGNDATAAETETVSVAQVVEHFGLKLRDAR